GAARSRRPPAPPRGAPAAGSLPALLTSLVRVPARRPAADEAGYGASGATTGAGADGTERRELSARLAGLAEAEQRKLLLDLVCEHVAAVLDLASPRAVRPGQALRDLGFDSLTAVEFRNRLGKDTGLRLPPTLVFDHPTPAELVEYLRTEAAPPAPGVAGMLAELDRIETALRITAEAGGEGGDAIASRLRDLLDQWATATTTGAADGETAREVSGTSGATGPADGGDGLHAATDDEMFDFIGKEFGIS
ncbi:phosphopantetheine-binding protein, partial [Streptomyces lavendulae]|uniref:phosphopantetheine-binding protein n=1 Tax=Streptomyces lavendulae TaxID=1914 RepID=UPI0036837A3B